MQTGSAYAQCACVVAINRIFELVQGARRARMRTRSTVLSKSADALVTNQLILNFSAEDFPPSYEFLEGAKFPLCVSLVLYLKIYTPPSYKLISF